jgi:hypothetical protein
MEAAAWLDLSNSESPEFIGRAIAALAADPDVMRHTGKVLVAAAVALDYGFTTSTARVHVRSRSPTCDRDAQAEACALLCRSETLQLLEPVEHHTELERELGRSRGVR